ncbi:unnamed protein product [Meganyctiphanes norvegica]|uniref:NADH dehydrogenase subunit 6 n=1 Tax=Meganyctiphanes norvegica TaxID=48144 RepID=A0AAV2RZ27_MEGNR
MAIDDITRQPLALLKLSQVVLLVISIGCVFGVANGWWYYVGATLVAAFLNTIIMLVCYFWKQTFETTFLELSYTSYFVLAIFISAILLFAQPHYAEAPWKPNDVSALQTTTAIPTSTTTPPTTTQPPTSITTTPPPTSSTTPSSTTPSSTTPSSTTPSSTTPSSTTPSSTIPSSTTPSSTTPSSTTPSSTPPPSTIKRIASTTSVPSTTSSKPPQPEMYSKEGPWIAGGVFCIFLSLTYSIELYFLTRRLVGFGGRPSSSSPPMPSQPGM